MFTVHFNHMKILPFCKIKKRDKQRKKEKIAIFSKAISNHKKSLEMQNANASLESIEKRRDF